MNADQRDRRALPPALGDLGLELRGVGDLPAADVAKQQRHATPADRLGRHAADIAVHVLGHQCRRQAIRVLNAGGDDRGAETGGHSVLQAEHDHRQPQRIGVGAAGNRDEGLPGRKRNREQQHKLEGDANECRPSRTPRRCRVSRLLRRRRVAVKGAAGGIAHLRLLRPSSSRGSILLSVLPVGSPSA